MSSFDYRKFIAGISSLHSKHSFYESGYPLSINEIKRGEGREDMIKNDEWEDMKKLMKKR